MKTFLVVRGMAMLASSSVVFRAAGQGKGGEQSGRGDEAGAGGIRNEDQRSRAATMATSAWSGLEWIGCPLLLPKKPLSRSRFQRQRHHLTGSYRVIPEPLMMDAPPPNLHVDLDWCICPIITQICLYIPVCYDPQAT